MLYPSPFNMQSKQPDQPPVEAWDLGKVGVLSFPVLSITIPASEPGLEMARSQAPQKKHMKTTSAHSEQLTSAPIPFPKAHVKRTPSEIQIDLNRRQAEYDIAQMNARIGKHSRARNHPSTFLTRNPTQKLDKEKKTGIEHQLTPRRRGSGGWKLAYSSNTVQNLKSRDSAKHDTVHKLEGDDGDNNEDIFRLDL